MVQRTIGAGRGRRFGFVAVFRGTFALSFRRDSTAAPS